MVDEAAADKMNQQMANVKIPAKLAVLHSLLHNFFETGQEGILGQKVVSLGDMPASLDILPLDQLGEFRILIKKLEVAVKQLVQLFRRFVDALHGIKLKLLNAIV